MGREQAPQTLYRLRILNIGVGIRRLFASLLRRLPAHKPSPGLSWRTRWLRRQIFPGIWPQVCCCSIFLH